MKTITFTILALFLTSTIFAQLSFWTLESELLNNVQYKANSVTISDEYALMSAHLDDEERGAAALFRLIDEEWEEIGVIKASDGEPGDLFSLGASIDGNQILIGAPTDNFNSNLTGKVYFFEIEDGQVTETASFEPDLSTNAAFGLISDMEGELAIVGAPDNQFGTGAVVIYRKGDNGWAEEQIVLPEQNYNTRSFGTGVSISGDWAAVGSYLQVPGGGGFQQVVFMYELIDGEWEMQQMIENLITSSTATTPSWCVGHQDKSLVFGYRFPGTGPSFVDGGAEFYSLSANEWTSTQVASAPDLTDGLFGRRVDMESEFAIIGYTEEPTNVDTAHQVIFYQQALDSWGEIGRFKLASTSISNFAGVEMDLSASFGMLGEPNAGGNSGRAYVIDLREFIMTTNVSGVVAFAESKLFPNPTSDFLTISAKANIDEILLFDELGRVVFGQKDAGNTEMEINVSSFPAGVYFVQIILESGRGEVHQVVVE